MRASIEAFPVVVPDGSAVVFRKDKVIGIAILRHQAREPEILGYDWYLREDGQLRFGVGAEGVKSGSADAVNSIDFGPFWSRWSINGEGRGYVYLSNDYFTGVVFQSTLEKLVADLIGTTLIKKLKGDISELDLVPHVPAK